MSQPDLKPDRVAVLRALREFGASICAGTCEHALPGELHCHGVGRAAGVSSTGAKRRLRELVDLGLVVLEQVVREDGKVVARYTLSPEGRSRLAAEQAGSPSVTAPG